MNYLDDYRCVCVARFTGRNCEKGLFLFYICSQFILTSFKVEYFGLKFLCFGGIHLFPVNERKHDLTAEGY